MTGPSSANDPVIVVGAGHAGVQFATRLRELEHPVPVVLVDGEGGVPYERPPLSKEMLTADGPADPPTLRRAEYYGAKGIGLLQGRQVSGVDRPRRRVLLDDGSAVGYSRLVLATGSTPHALPVPGADLAGVQVLKTAADATRLRAALDRRCRLVVVGAGYIGLEVAAAAVKTGCAVTVIEGGDRVMARVAPEVVSRHFESLHRRAGVRLLMGESVVRIEGDGRVERVRTTGGETLPADVVVAGIGVRPHQQLAQECGIACDDGILVDDVCRTSDPSVYAIGDVSRTMGVDPVGTRLECVQNATAQALAAATHIATGAHSRPEVPWFWTVQHGVRLQSAGLRRDGDETIVRGDPATGKFSVLHLRGGRLVSIDTVGSLKDFVPAKKMIAAGTPVDRAAVADPAVKLGRAVAVAA